MSSSAPTKRNHRPNTVATGLLGWLLPVFTSTIGSKVLVALTGLGLVGFVIAHMVGNLKIFGGQDALNTYAKFLKDTGPLLWVARGGLIVIFVTHIVLVVRLKARSAAARPVPYAYERTIQASSASRYMLVSGLVILTFLLFHLAHYTFGYVTTVDALDRSTGATVKANYLQLRDAAGRHDVYAMVVDGFKQPVIAGLYVLAQLFLLWHLSHGISSVFQTLSLNSSRVQPFIKKLGWALALVIAAGNIGIVAAVYAGAVPDAPKYVASSAK